MAMDEKYDCTDCARINDHEAVKGFASAKMGFREVVRQTPSRGKERGDDWSVKKMGKKTKQKSFFPTLVQEQDQQTSVNPAFL